MQKINESHISFRQGGNHGSKYLHRGEDYELGKIVIPPETKYAEHSHFHKKTEEVFWFIEGEPLFLINKEKIRVRKGDVYVIEPGEKHNILNDTNRECFIVFSKSPRLLEDRFEVDEED